MEKIVEQYLVDEVKKLGGIALKFISPSMSGVPDRIVLLPAGNIFFVELKDKGKKPTAIQLQVHRLLTSLGFDVCVIDSKEQVDEVIREWSVIFHTDTRH
jgi:hypothetical protein